MDEKTRRIFIARLKRDIERNNQALAPLESGTMTFGEKRPGGEWKDITQEEIATLKRINQTLQDLIDEIKAEASQ